MALAGVLNKAKKALTNGLVNPPKPSVNLASGNPATEAPPAPQPGGIGVAQPPVPPPMPVVQPPPLAPPPPPPVPVAAKVAPDAQAPAKAQPVAEAPVAAVPPPPPIQSPVAPAPAAPPVLMGQDAVGMVAPPREIGPDLTSQLGPGLVANEGAGMANAAQGYTPESTPIDPLNSLRGTSILPTSSGREAAAAARTDRSLDATEKVDRGALAKQTYDALTADSAENLQNAEQQILRRAAGAGRLGMGDTVRDVDAAYRDSSRDRSNIAARLAAEAASGGVEDTFRRTGIFSGAENQIGSQNRSARDETRGERGYTDQLANEAMDRQRQGRFDQEDILNSQFGRASRRLDAGSQDTPWAEQLDAAGQYAGDADAAMQANSEMLRLNSMERARARGINPAVPVAGATRPGGDASSGYDPRLDPTSPEYDENYAASLGYPEDY